MSDLASNNEELLARINDLIKANNLTQVELANKAQIEESAFSKSMNNKRKFTINELGDISKALNVTLDYLVNGTESDTASASVPKHIDVDDIVNNQAMLTSRNHALSDEDRKAIRALLTTYLNSDEGQDRLRRFGGYGDDGKKTEDEK